MAIVAVGSGSGVGAGVGAEAFAGMHVRQVPLSHGSLGHYRTAIKLTMVTSQNANSRLFELRNSHATNLIVLTRLYVMAVVAGTVTTAYLGEFAAWKCTGFTAIDTTNTVTPTSSVKRTSGMAVYPGNAVVRHNTVAGAQAGMTGGTLTKDGNSFGSMLAPLATLAAGSQISAREFLEDMNGTHPFVFAQNEGFEVENVVAGSGTANVVHVLIDASWAEVSAF